MQIVLPPLVSSSVENPEHRRKCHVSTLRMPRRVLRHPRWVIPTSGERGEVSHTITPPRPVVTHPQLVERGSLGNSHGRVIRQQVS